MIVTMLFGVVAHSQRVADLFAGGFEVAHVHRAVGLGRSADAEEDDLGVLDRLGDISGELELAGSVVLLHQLLEARLPGISDSGRPEGS